MLLLREKREEKGLSQQELARLSGVAQQTISNIEKGNRLNPGIDTVSQLAMGLECEISDLFVPDRKPGQKPGQEASANNAG